MRRKYSIPDPMKQIVKILTLLLAVTAVWIGLLQTSTIPESYTWLLPLYLIVSLGCYGLLMVGIGLMNFPTCPQEALFLQQDIVEAKDFLKKKGVDVGAD
ncbi:dolichol-phosphate mannose synthase subunit 3 isoform X2 [Lycium barbarum]|uniref:dolichol-phosphate mannose synthase subunit 3 isoform X2 n=1 Tax=Lycium barbarum TaxID=112863 RepID=UPI00293F11EA|nr:dolichol-phosphate mannose synthase subunit 3 isoform X2 [Lycium barbarum]